ncbi:MAG: tetratricopeptide repeat protein [bacterium]
MLDRLVIKRAAKYTGFLFFLLIAVSGPVNASYQRGLELEKAGEYSRALKNFREHYRQNLTHAPAVLGRLRTAIELEEWQLAEESLEIYERLEPETEDAAKLAVKLYFYQDEYDTALKWAEVYIDRAPGDWAPYHFKVQVQFARRDFIDARDAVISAERRSRNNPWVMMDRFLVELVLEEHFNEELLEDIIQFAENPVIFWRLAREEQLSDRPDEILRLLELGIGHFPASRPPFLPRITIEKYRYWLARFHYLADNRQQAKEILTDAEQSDRVIWLQSLLATEPSDRVELLETLLQKNPDNIIYRWQYSRAVRELEGITGSRRHDNANFFFREFENLDNLAFEHASYAALMRSLELNPLEAKRQFELARFFRELGWEKSERRAVRRANELGISPPEEIEDYAEALDTPEGAEAADSVSGSVVFRIKIASGWDFPPGGDRLLASMLRQAFYHQPALVVSSVPEEVDSQASLDELLAQANADLAVEIEILKWTDLLNAEIEYLYTDGGEGTERFFDRERTGIWRFIDRVISISKENWPWQGEVYEVDAEGCRVNLGRVHGITDEDEFKVSEYLLPVESLRENSVKLSFPTPIMKGRMERGMKAELQ